MPNDQLHHITECCILVKSISKVHTKGFPNIHRESFQLHLVRNRPSGVSVYVHHNVLRAKIETVSPLEHERIAEDRENTLNSRHVIGERFSPFRHCGSSLVDSATVSPMFCPWNKGPNYQQDDRNDNDRGEWHDTQRNHAIAAWTRRLNGPRDRSPGALFNPSPPLFYHAIRTGYRP